MGYRYQKGSLPLKARGGLVQGQARAKGGSWKAKSKAPGVSGVETQGFCWDLAHRVPLGWLSGPLTPPIPSPIHPSPCALMATWVTPQAEVTRSSGVQIAYCQIQSSPPPLLIPPLHFLTFTSFLLEARPSNHQMPDTGMKRSRPPLCHCGAARRVTDKHAGNQEAVQGEWEHEKGVLIKSGESEGGQARGSRTGRVTKRG